MCALSCILFLIFVGLVITETIILPWAATCKPAMFGTHFHMVMFNMVIRSSYGVHFSSFRIISPRQGGWQFIPAGLLLRCLRSELRQDSSLRNWHKLIPFWFHWSHLIPKLFSSWFKNQIASPADDSWCFQLCSESRPDVIQLVVAAAIRLVVRPTLPMSHGSTIYILGVFMFVLAGRNRFGCLAATACRVWEIKSKAIYINMLYDLYSYILPKAGVSHILWGQWKLQSLQFFLQLLRQSFSQLHSQ